MAHWQAPASLIVAILQVSCATVASTEATLQRLEPEPGPAQTVQLVRFCEVGDCRVQRAEMTMPDGEVLSGTLTQRTASVRSGVGIANLQAQASKGGGPNVRLGTLRLSADQGMSLECNLLLRIGGRHANGSCTTEQTDEKYRLDY